MGRTVAITGVGGFIGLRIASLARDAGHVVRGLELSEAASRRAEAARIFVLRGDVTDPQAVARLCEGADVVIHTAAVVEEDGAMDHFRRVNVGGTRAVAEAARAAGVRRFVQLSSVMVYGFRFPRDVAEDGPLRGEGNPYCETKIESERAAMELHRSGGMEVVVVRPGDVYGPGSIPWIVRPMELMRRHLFMLPSGAGVINHVFIDNLVDAVLLAAERPVGGEVFNVTDGIATPCARFFRYHTDILGKRPPRAMPTTLLRGFGRVVGRAYRTVGKRPPMLPAAVDYLMRPHAYAIGKARAMLGYAPRVPLDEGMDQVRAWWQREHA
jgi:nucleoside-diphosphate-sugar epimerase